LRSLLAVVALLTASLAVSATPALAAPNGGAVFALSNRAEGNTVLVYARANDGTLAAVDEVDTGGLGSGAGLGSQGGCLRSTPAVIRFPFSGSAVLISSCEESRIPRATLPSVLTYMAISPL
jgi:hypothetical protein